MHGRSFQTIEDFILLSHNIFATAVFSTTQVPDEENEDFELLTQLVIYGLKEIKRGGQGHEEDKRIVSHEAKEVSDLHFSLCQTLIPVSQACSARAPNLQRHRNNL